MTAAAHPDLALWVGGLCSFAAALGVVYLSLASILIMRFRTLPRVKANNSEPASILVPLCGEDGRLHESLTALCRQSYDAAVELICGVQNANDPATRIVEAVAAENPKVRIDLKIDAKQYGGNRKVSNLINMAPLARTGLLVIIDSDILVGPNHLSDIVSEFDGPRVGAVTCLYHGISGAGLWSSLSALSLNADFLPSVALALTFGLARPCFGATIALRRRTLETIGGFRAFADCLHDDYAIGESVREAGYEVAIPRFSVGHVCRERTARALIQNQFRAARTIRMINPLGYVGSIVAHPMAFAIPAALLDPAYGAPMLLFALAGRLILCLSVEYAFSLQRQTYWLLPFYDLIFLVVYVASFFGGPIVWRDQRYQLKPDGTLVPDELKPDGTLVPDP